MGNYAFLWKNMKKLKRYSFSFYEWFSWLISVMIYILMSRWFLIYWVALLVCWNIFPGQNFLNIFLYKSSIEIVWSTYFHWCEVTHFHRVIATYERTIQISTKHTHIVSRLIEQTFQIFHRNALKWYSCYFFCKFFLNTCLPQ